jgi:hypothetical protein
MGGGATGLSPTTGAVGSMPIVPTADGCCCCTGIGGCSGCFGYPFIEGGDEGESGSSGAMTMGGGGPIGVNLGCDSTYV